jgi:plastocyanin
LSAIYLFLKRWFLKKLVAVLGLALALETSLAIPPVDIAGKVEILDKGGIKRKRIQNVLVYVDGVKVPVPPALVQGDFQVVSQNKAFAPHIEAVPVGATVSFPNLDDIMHNVFSISRGNRFDLGLYKSGASKERRFDSPGLVRIYCNIHPQMSGFVLVRDNPYYAWAQTDGTFKIGNIPPGTYTVKAWSEQAQTEMKVEVGAGGAKGVSFLLDASRFKRKPHLNKFGKPYKKKRVKY